MPTVKLNRAIKYRAYPTVEHYQDDVCIIPAEIKSIQTKEILAQIKQIQATQYNTNGRNRKSTITLPVHLEEKSHG